MPSIAPQSSPAPSDPRKLTAESLRALHRFLSFADPDAAEALPLDDSRDGSNGAAGRETAIADWNVLYSTAVPASAANADNVSQPFAPSLTVRAHPDPARTLFSVQSVIPGVSARQFWSLMSTAENRRLWDSTVEEGTVHRWLAQELEHHAEDDDDAARLRDIARATAARVELFRFGSIFMVAKARDMVLLSVDARLPPAASSSSGNGVNTRAEPPLRLVSTSCCTEDPSLPPRKGYTRFPLQVGGFMVEDLGDDGLADILDHPEPARKSAAAMPAGKKGIKGFGRRKESSSSGQAAHTADLSTSSGVYRHKDPRGPAVLITQVSDLGEMAAWVPASVVKMVASTLVPRSIASIGKVAKTMQVHRALYEAAEQRASGGSQTAPAWTTREKLAGGGEWYAHRRLPTMVGTGCLCRSKPDDVQPASPRSGLVQGTKQPRAASPASKPSSPLSAMNSLLLQFSPKKKPRQEEPSTDKAAEAPPPAIVPAAATPPPRLSSLPGTPVGAAVAASPTSPFKLPLAPGSPSKTKPGLSIDLLGLNPLPFRASGAISPYIPGRSPGMYSDSDAGIDDMMSISGLSTPGRFGGRLGRRFDPAFPIAPSDSGTETVPGSVASEMEERGRGDYLSKGRRGRETSGPMQLYGLTNEQLRRSNLLLTPDGTQPDDELVEELQADVTIMPDAAGNNNAHSRPFATPGREDAESLMFVGSFSPRGSYRERALSLSPAARRATLISQELMASEPRSVDARTGTKEFDRRVRRMSRALLAEVEKRNRRNLSGSMHGSSSSESHPADRTERRERSEDGARLEPKEDVIDLLAEALSQSLPMAQMLEERRRSNAGRGYGASRTQEQERIVMETARSVSAMLLAGSDAFAMALAPAARESLALGFDGLSTASETSEPRTPAQEQSPVSSIIDIKHGPSATRAAKRFPIGLGPQPSESSSLGCGGRPALRSRKPSVNSSSRSISVSHAFAQPETTTTVTHAVSRSYISTTASTFSSSERDSQGAVQTSSSLTPPSGHSHRPSEDTATSASTTSASAVPLAEEHLAIEKLKALKAKHVATRRSVQHQRVASRPGGVASSSSSGTMGSGSGSIAHRQSNSALRPGAYAMMSGLIGLAWSGRGVVPPGAAATGGPADSDVASSEGRNADAIPRISAPTPSQPTASNSSSNGTGGRINHTRTSHLSNTSTSPPPSTRPRIPAKGSVGRLKSRQNYRLDLNAKLHPFPGSDSLGRAHGRKLPPLHASDEQARRARVIMARSSRHVEGVEEGGEEEEEGEEEWVDDERLAVSVSGPASGSGQGQGQEQDQAGARGWLSSYYWPPPTATSASSSTKTMHQPPDKMVGQQRTGVAA